MDISSIGSYVDTVKNAAGSSLEAMKADYQKLSSKSGEEELLDACKQFESYYIEYMYKEMWKTVPESDYSSNSTRSMVDYYKDNMIKEFASMTSEQGDLGLAQMLYEQLKVNLGGITEVPASKYERMMADLASSEADEGADTEATEETETNKDAVADTEPAVE